MKPSEVFQKVQLQKPNSLLEKQESGEERSSNALSTGHSESSVLDQAQSTLEDSGLSSTSTIGPAPLCRQFWKSGSYDNGHSTKISIQSGRNYLHVHPMFLHSNATSHKWAFGAIAELLDNAVDEIQNGATYVIIDKTLNPRDGSPALLIQDDGGGMDPEALRRCMSFGFSDKKEKSAIGQYGNGFKTSTMRLGADVIVFSRHMKDSMFDDIGSHGTKIIIYNLWYNDDGKMELDFDAHPQDIRISGDIKKVETIPAWKQVNEQHIANQLHYSLRVYMSILYLRIPESFKIVLRGQNVEHHNIADDLKYIQYILYRPQTAGFVEGQVVTTIGFLKEAPHVNLHGFNVYYKNRLILPFWRVVTYTDSRGRGVVGVLEANFIEPTHNKQDFERTSLFQKLEVRLKEMTSEYWKVRASVFAENTSHSVPHGGVEKPILLGQSSPSMTSISEALGEPIDIPGNQSNDVEAANMVQEHKKLLAKCSEYENSVKELSDKLARLRSELGEAQRDHSRLLAEALSLGSIKKEDNASMPSR
ncbi:hypothetical protein EUGRSUZ_B00250 [Eucalyptus grandis]|uniref:Uncharacterized protein n=1 Tax=Eucalyptus grandis TaxID=71139 RepID=A0ACC3LM95_EUCGR|nr:hypothetical protein EUGRSUZ_B00250 [Eucalyptus grandis]